MSVQPALAGRALERLLPVGNQGGFRFYGGIVQEAVKLAVLYTSGAEPDWPDALDSYTGTFTYFGDNRSPGSTTEVSGRVSVSAGPSQNERFRKLRTSADSSAGRFESGRGLGAMLGTVLC